MTAKGGAQFLVASRRGKFGLETRYATVAKVLSEAIGTGRYPVGSVLPNELELAVEFGVSRSTIRAALRELQVSGLVSRKTCEPQEECRYEGGGHEPEFEP